MYSIYREEYINKVIRKEMIENTETCHHFINYEIYDYLTDNLKEIYIEQFNSPNFIIQKNGDIRIECKANDFDPITCARYVNCSHRYPETIKNIKIRFKSLFPQE